MREWCKNVRRVSTSDDGDVKFIFVEEAIDGYEWNFLDCRITVYGGEWSEGV